MSYRQLATRPDYSNKDTFFRHLKRFVQHHQFVSSAVKQELIPIGVAVGVVVGIPLIGLLSGWFLLALTICCTPWLSFHTDWSWFNDGMLPLVVLGMLFAITVSIFTALGLAATYGLQQYLEGMRSSWRKTAWRDPE